jgi:hypothetical protein
MKARVSLLTSLAAIAVASCAVGCSSSTTGAAADAGDGGGGGPVSFAKDVLPVLQMNCTTGNVCHGSMRTVNVENLFLAPSSGPIDAATAKMIYDELVGVKSLEDPSMDLVTPKNPDRSFLLQKVLGTQDKLASECLKAPSLCPSPTCGPKTPCGTTMPYLGEMLGILDPMGLQNLTDWIAQGAKDN